VKDHTKAERHWPIIRIAKYWRIIEGRFSLILGFAAYRLGERNREEHCSFPPDKHERASPNVLGYSKIFGKPHVYSVANVGLANSGAEIGCFIASVIQNIPGLEITLRLESFSCRPTCMRGARGVSGSRLQVCDA
jgi:hypothetical protein